MIDGDGRMKNPLAKPPFKRYEDFTKNFGDRIFMIPQIGGVQLYESTWPIMGQARWAYYCRKDPEFIQMLIR